jgi:hypothetical protein
LCIIFPVGTWDLNRGWDAWCVKLTTHLHLVARLMCGAIPLLPKYVFMAWCLIKQEIRLHDVLC